MSENWYTAPAGTFQIFSIGPKTWEEEPDFWENLYDSEEKALALYKKEVVIMLEEKGLSSV